MTPESFTPRGFADYCSLTDRYGQKVTVRQSSLATEDCVWIFCEPAPGSGRPDTPTPHLTVEQAKRVREGLTEFIEEHDQSPLARLFRRLGAHRGP